MHGARIALAGPLLSPRPTTLPLDRGRGPPAADSSSFMSEEDIGDTQMSLSPMPLLSLVQTSGAMESNPLTCLEGPFRRLLAHAAGRIEEFLPDRWPQLRLEAPK